ncbi:hypothetical protein A343_1751 [Porphyromonas gingivalis JCVI SC001]|nr:hypothetical protein A343_1751 [Porphyromonas gingivalis JCVI SC001]
MRRMPAVLFHGYKVTTILTNIHIPKPGSLSARKGGAKPSFQKGKREGDML